MAALLLAFLVVALPLVAQTVEQWQRSAVQKHPALAQAGSPLNARFLAIVAEKRKADPGFFTKPDWPLRAAEEAAAALRAEEQAANEKKAEMARAEAARLEAMTPDEREWEAEKARWVFERLVFGDDEQKIVRKLSLSKTVTSRAAPSARVPLGSRFWWVMGESKFYLDFEMKDGLAAITFDSLAERSTSLDSVIHEDWNKLRAAAIEKFGPPTKVAEFPDDAKKLRAGGWTVTDTWERPGFRVKLGLTEDDGKASTSLRISDPKRAAE
jgi:hypothetical protein